MLATYTMLSVTLDPKNYHPRALGELLAKMLRFRLRAGQLIFADSEPRGAC